MELNNNEAIVKDKNKYGFKGMNIIIKMERLIYFTKESKKHIAKKMKRNQRCIKNEQYRKKRKKMVQQKMVLF